MEIIHLAATHSDQRKVFNGRYSRQLTWGAGQHTTTYPAFFY